MLNSSLKHLNFIQIPQFSPQWTPVRNRCIRIQDIHEQSNIVIQTAVCHSINTQKKTPKGLGRQTPKHFDSFFLLGVCFTFGSTGFNNDFTIASLILMLRFSANCHMASIMTILQISTLFSFFILGVAYLHHEICITNDYSTLS